MNLRFSLLLELASVPDSCEPTTSSRNRNTSLNVGSSYLVVLLTDWMRTHGSPVCGPLNDRIRNGDAVRNQEPHHSLLRLAHLGEIGYPHVEMLGSDVYAPTGGRFSYENHWTFSFEA